MIALCPHCGHHLSKPIVDGITSCKNCNRVSDTSPFNRILSASWMARRQNITEVENLVQYGYKHEEALLVITFVVENCLNHEEFVKALTNLGISNQYQICVDLAG